MSLDELLDPDWTLALEVLDQEHRMTPCGVELSRDIYDKLRAAVPEAKEDPFLGLSVLSFRVYVRDDWGPGRAKYIYPPPRVAFGWPVQSDPNEK